MNLETPPHPGERALLDEFSRHQLECLATYVDSEKFLRAEEGYGQQTIETLAYMAERLRFLAHNQTIINDNGPGADGQGS